MIPTSQVPPVYHRRVGDILVTAMSDGAVEPDLACFIGLTESEAREMFRRDGQAGSLVSVNTFLLRTENFTVLVDAGSSNFYGDVLGELPRTMEAAGVRPEDIDAVLLTHMHPDHSGGLIYPDGRAFFPRAELVVDRTEYDHWHDDEAAAAADERKRLRYFTWTRRQLDPYRDRLRFTPRAGAEIFPGIRAIPTPGHTPGHTGYMIESRQQRLFIWGDVAHMPSIQVPRPDISVIYDTDPGQAAETRRIILEMLASQDIPVAGMHIHFPGFASIVRSGDGYRLAPEPWAYRI